MQQMVVNIPVADLRKEPEHRSERVSQLLYGFAVTVTEVGKDFRKVTADDGYSGWIGSSYLVEATESDFETKRVASPFAKFDLMKPKRLFVLPFGALVWYDKKKRIYLTNDVQEKLTLLSGELESPDSKNGRDPIRTARLFLSTPYLWGGTSSYGFDCSGLTQAIFRRAGVILPRDSKDQAKTGEEIELKNSVSGDLIFFPGHVALNAGKLEIIHATRLRGMVIVESLNPEHPAFRADLAGKISTVRRIIS